MSILVISKNNLWTDCLLDELNNLGVEINFSNECSVDIFEKIKPDVTFFFHWSDVVSKQIYSAYKCIVVHTSPLPDFKGGSPLQNQILSKRETSQVNLIEMKDPVDSGDVFCSEQVSLQGSISDIWVMVSKITAKLIKFYIEQRPIPTPQTGVGKTYKRIKNNEIILKKETSLLDVYDKIRMVDGSGYPNAFVIFDGFKLEFSRATINNKNEILSDVRISKL